MSGSGFPNRPTRTAFGPERQNERPVQNPERELDASDMNLDFWQVAGMGLVVPRVTIIAVVSGGAIVTPYAYQGIAWDPKKLLAPIPNTYFGGGDYAFTFAASYVDQLGTLVATSLKGAKVSPQSLLDIRGVARVTSPTQVSVRLRDAAGAPIDSDFLLEIW